MIIGLGTELVDVDSLRSELAHADAAWLAFSWTDGERETCLKRVDAAPGLAARLAAKRAAMSALGCRDGDPLEVEIVREASGKPRLALHGAIRAEAERLGVVRQHVSLTHLESHALAFVLFESGPA